MDKLSNELKHKEKGLGPGPIADTVRIAVSMTLRSLRPACTTKEESNGLDRIIKTREDKRCSG